MKRLRNCLNAEDFRLAAQRRLPSPLFHYIEGGSDDEVTSGQNTSAYEKYKFIPRQANGVESISLKSRVLGMDLDWPLILSPTGMTKLFHPDGEIGVANAANKAGVAYSLSTMATTSIENIADAISGPKIFQLYLFKDDELNFEILNRCKAAGFDAVCLTVDTVIPGNRERDIRTGLTIPPKLSLQSFLEFAIKPQWCLNYLKGSKFSLPNISQEKGGDLSVLATYFSENMESQITWSKIERIAAHWAGPFAVKGLQCIEDVKASKASGASAVIVSNHGGRQLDSVPSSFEMIADIADATGDTIEIIQDGGIRRGSHIVKSFAMGAKACMTGRPYLYALSAFGTEGVESILESLRIETEKVVGLLGCSHIDEVNREHLRYADELPYYLTGAHNLPFNTKTRRT